MPEKSFSINFNKAKIKLCFSFYHNGDNSYLYVNKPEIYRFKTYDNTCWYEFCLGSVSKDFMKDEQSEIFLNGTLLIFQS